MLTPAAKLMLLYELQQRSQKVGEGLTYSVLCEMIQEVKEQQESWRHFEAPTYPEGAILMDYHKDGNYDPKVRFSR